MINLIVAYDKNRAIGRDGKLVWKQSDDLKRVKALTQGQTLLMGRKTFDSLPGLLPGRIHRVLSREPKAIQRTQWYTDPEQAISDYETEQLFLFGGEAIYRMFLDKAVNLYVTEIDADIQGDAFFPEIDDKWELVSSETFPADEKNEYPYTFKHYIRKDLTHG